MKAAYEKNINSFIIAHHTKVHILLFYVFIFIYKYIFFLGEPLRAAFGCPRVGLSAPSPARLFHSRCGWFRFYPSRFRAESHLWCDGAARPKNLKNHVRNVVSHVRNLVSHVRNVVSYVRNLVSHVHDLVSHVRDVVSHVRDVVSHVRDVVSYVRDVVSHVHDVVFGVFLTKK